MADRVTKSICCENEYIGSKSVLLLAVRFSGVSLVVQELTTGYYPDDHFRARFLHGRIGMLRACAREMHKLQGRKDLVWVDLGGGTGQNVETMASICDLSLFKKVYVVDICGPLCDVAREKVAKYGWTNVEVVEADVCDYEPEASPATLVTFSYSLSSNLSLNCVNFLFLVQGRVPRSFFSLIYFYFYCI